MSLITRAPLADLHRISPWRIRGRTTSSTSCASASLNSSTLRSDQNVLQSAGSLAGPWSIGSYLAPPGTRTYNTQSGYNIRIQGTKQTCEDSTLLL